MVCYIKYPCFFDFAFYMNHHIRLTASAQSNVKENVTGELILAIKVLLKLAFI